MKLEYLEEFLALARTNNYSTAAEDLFISVSTLSRHIILLEDELGVELFNRGARTVTLNRAGELLYPYAETIIRAKENFDVALAAEKNHAQPTLSIGFSRAAIKYGILEKLMRFQENHPDVRFTFAEASPTHLLQMLRRDECNFILSYKYIFHNNSDYSTQPLIRDRLSVAVCKDNPLSRQESLTLQDLKHERLIIHDKSSPTHKRHREMFQDEGMNLNNCIQAESTEFIIDLVAHGLGVSLVGHRRFEGKLPANVVLVPLEPEVPQTLVLTYKRHKLNEVEESFFKYIKEECI